MTISEKGELRSITVSDTGHGVDSVASLIKIVEYMERNTKIFMCVIVLEVIGAFLSPIFTYWISVLLSLVVGAIGIVLGYWSFKKVKEIHSG